MTVMNPMELDNAARNPLNYRKVMSTKDYRDLMVQTNGELVAVGSTWRWVGKSLGAGLYEVTLKRRTF